MASKPATTVTLKHLAATLAEDNELSKKQAEAILGGLVGNIVKHLKKGERIRIGGLGILQVRKRAARMGRNPATGEPIQDQGEQEGRLPRFERTQRSHLTLSSPIRDDTGRRTDDWGRKEIFRRWSSVLRPVTVRVGSGRQSHRDK